MLAEEKPELFLKSTERGRSFRTLLLAVIRRRAACGAPSWSWVGTSCSNCRHLISDRCQGTVSWESFRVLLVRWNSSELGPQIIDGNTMVLLNEELLSWFFGRHSGLIGELSRLYRIEPPKESTF